MSWWNRFDRWLAGVETKGFKVANKLHVYTINMILVGLAYGTYTLFRDYNEFFKAGRVNNESKDFTNEYFRIPIMVWKKMKICPNLLKLIETNMMEILAINCKEDRFFSN